jgi:hypothetical protein
MNTTSQKLLNIGMNITRISNWITDDYSSKVALITIFLDKTTNELQLLTPSMMPTKLSQEALRDFKHEYPKIQHRILTSTKPDSYLSEKLATWGTILTGKSYLFVNHSTLSHKQ